MFWFKQSIKDVIIIIILFENAKIWVGQTTLNKEKGDGTCFMECWVCSIIIECVNFLNNHKTSLVVLMQRRTAGGEKTGNSTNIQMVWIPPKYPYSNQDTHSEMQTLYSIWTGPSLGVLSYPLLRSSGKFKCNPWSLIWNIASLAIILSCNWFAQVGGEQWIVKLSCRPKHPDTR